MKFIRRFLHEVGSEIALKKLAQEDPGTVQSLVARVRRFGYPTPQDEGEDIFWDEFSRQYGIPRGKEQDVGTGNYCR